MPQVDLISAGYVIAEASAVAAAIHDRAFWATLWPGLELSVFQDRGLQGIRWNCSGALSGSCEVWLEAYGRGVIVHCYLRADPPPGRSAAAVRRAARRREIRVNQVLLALKDSFEDRSSTEEDLPTPQE
ncbi:MAG: polyketide cyclase / dehydrase and lipid transport [Actinomycetota bacterium]|nr:polyketide cyclase / dehydrase and lipid transport [Actinomycetota bacterium]